MMHWDWQGWNIKLYFSGWFCFEWSLSSSSPSCPIFDYASGCPAPFGSICAVPFRFRLPTSWSVRSAPSLPWIPCFSLSWSSARCGAPSAGPRSPAAAAPPGQPKSDCGNQLFVLVYGAGDPWSADHLLQLLHAYQALLQTVLGFHVGYLDGHGGVLEGRLFDGLLALMGHVDLHWF